ncbi:MAG: AMP-dependent synthetase/ligase [Solirubrobacteraceae bacterium]
MGAPVETSRARSERSRALDAQTMCEAFQLTAGEHADEVALRTINDGLRYTFREYSALVRRLAAGLRALGVRRGETVGFMLTNRPEFHLLDTAAIHLGATPFSIYNTSSAEQIAYLLADAGCRLVVVEAAFLHRMRAALEQTPDVEQLVLLDAEASDALTLAQLQQLDSPGFDFDLQWRAVSPDDVLTLIYTSGTTGPPKGVELTHRGLLAECRALDAAQGGRPSGGAVISFLPTAHIADRTLAHYVQMIWGDTVTTCPDPARVFEHTIDARPTSFGAVPRVWEKLMAALQAGIGSEPDERRRAATLDAIELGLRKVRAEQSGEPLDEKVALAYARADETVFSKVRAGLGFDRCEMYYSGAAPAPVELFEFFAAIGIEICEVWGMSELSCVATLVPRDALRFGTVGKPLPGVELKLAADGEVLVRGEIVMAGYRNQPEKTAETIDGDGWLYTGDVGSLDADGYLRIIDRKKELIINSAGKNMSPANIEQHLKSSGPLVGQAIVIGDRRPYNVALVVLDPDACAAFAARHGLADGSVAAIATEPAALDEIAAYVERANSHLSRVEQIKRFAVLDCDWPPGGDELTPTMKLRRKPIAEKYAAKIEDLYR